MFGVGMLKVTMQIDDCPVATRFTVEAVPHHMQKIIAGLSPQTEAAIVLLIAFGWQAAISLLHLAGLLAEPGEVDQAVLLIVAEPLILIAVYAFLRLRGERIEPQTLIPKPLDFLYGCGLAGLAYFAFALLMLLASALLPDLIATPDPATPTIAESPPMDLALTDLAFLIHGAFEELLLCGYLISRLRRFVPVWNAIHLSVLLRLLCHIDSGAEAVLEVIPLGLAFAGWFSVTGKLWPLIIGHLLIDLLALVS
jgi:membrane protease YdiL (CAAX protease family)